jgi:hypothetical protein
MILLEGQGARRVSEGMLAIAQSTAPAGRATRQRGVESSLADASGFLGFRRVEPTRIILLVQHVLDRGRQVRHAEDPANAAAFGPPFAPPFSLRNPQFHLLLAESPATPGFQLFADDFRGRRGRQHDMHVVRAAVHRVQGPALMPARLGHLLVNAFALVGC